MKVLQYFQQADYEQLHACYVDSYKEDGWAKAETWSRFLAYCNGLVRVAGEPMEVVVSHSILHDCYSVDGRTPGESKSKWALDFTPWGEWLEMEVVDVTGKDLSISQIAAHIYQEMTWHGWPQHQEEKRDDLLDKIQGLTRQLGGE